MTRKRQLIYILLIVCLYGGQLSLVAQTAAAGDDAADRALDPDVRQSFTRLIESFEAGDPVADELSRLREPVPVSESPSDSPDVQLDVETDALPYPSALQKARLFHRQGETALAIRAYVETLNTVQSTPEQIKAALIGLAELYFERGALSRSISILEKFLQNFPQDERRPEILFQVGLLYREMGLHQQAIAIFYRVLNSIVVTGEVNLRKYLNLARRAQFEIARAHFDSSQWDQALLLFDRINLFELNPQDRETLLYYKVQATLRSGALQEGLALLDSFIRTYPNSPMVPEMLYTQAETLFQLQRSDDAAHSLLRLLEKGGIPGEADNSNWTYWRQQAGNRFANRFYESRDFLAALRIYQGLVNLSDSAQWQLPIIYQIGLCFEKLGMFDRAVQSFQFVVDELAAQAGQAGTEAHLGLEQLRRNAEWRLDMLNWRNGFEQRLQQLQQEPSPPTPGPTHATD